MNEGRIKLLNKYILEEPNNPFNIYALAMEFYEEQPEKALELLEQLVEQFPNYVPTYFKITHLFWGLEEWNKANELFLKGIEHAQEQNEEKAIHELKSAYQNFLIDMDS